MMASLDMKSVKEEYEKLHTKIFPDLRLAMLHGQMKSKEKEEVMRKFKAREYDVLVATTVIEVGVDVPNATIMMIEGADRFGLAQLYQLRGRVGRGEHQSHCFLMADTDAKAANDRLRAILEAKNGFELAEKDLALRGPGQFFGEVQTGLPDVAMTALQDPELVKVSREAAIALVQKDPVLKTYPLLKAKMTEFRKAIHLE
jgi:ATP-dependent DNA helicase RecG